MLAQESLFLSCEGNRGSEENDCGAKGEMINLPIFTYMQSIQVSTCLRYHLNALGNFLYLHIIFFRIQLSVSIFQSFRPMQITYVSYLLSVRITNLNLITQESTLTFQITTMLLIIYFLVFAW